MHEKSQLLRMNLSVYKPALALPQSLPFSVSPAQRYVLRWTCSAGYTQRLELN